MSKFVSGCGPTLKMWQTVYFQRPRLKFSWKRIIIWGNYETKQRKEAKRRWLAISKGHRLQRSLERLRESCSFATLNWLAPRPKKLLSSKFVWKNMWFLHICLVDMYVALVEGHPCKEIKAGGWIVSRLARKPSVLGFTFTSINADALLHTP